MTQTTTTTTLLLFTVKLIIVLAELELGHIIRWLLSLVAMGYSTGGGH